MVSHLLTRPEVSIYITFVIWSLCYKLSSTKAVVDSSSSFDVWCWAAERFVQWDFTMLRLESKTGALQVSDPDWQEFQRRNEKVRSRMLLHKKPTTQTPNIQKACCGHHSEYFSSTVLKTRESIQRNGNKCGEVLRVIIQLRGILSSCIQSPSLVSFLLVNFLMVLKPNSLYLIPRSSTLHVCNAFEIFSSPIPVSNMCAKTSLIFYWNPKRYFGGCFLNSYRLLRIASGIHFRIFVLKVYFNKVYLSLTPAVWGTTQRLVEQEQWLNGNFYI